ncbi:MAG: hypothetical protein WC520_01500 [Candidatus Paceibacterota bacterium]
MVSQLKIGMISIRSVCSLKGINGALKSFGVNPNNVDINNTGGKSGIIKITLPDDNAGCENELLLPFNKNEVSQTKLIQELFLIKRKKAQAENPNLELLPCVDEPFENRVFERVPRPVLEMIDRDYFARIAAVLHENHGDSVNLFIEELCLLDASQIMLKLEEHLKKNSEE